MGNRFSKEKHQRTNSRPSTSSGNTQPAPTGPSYPYQQLKLDPRDQHSTPYYQQQQQQPSARPTGKRRRGKPKPEYKLHVICSTRGCERPGACLNASDFNRQCTNAYRNPVNSGEKEPWTLQVDLCGWTDVHKEAKNALRRYVKDRTYGAYGDDEVFCVDDLLRDLRRTGVKMWSSI